MNKLELGSVDIKYREMMVVGKKRRRDNVACESDVCLADDDLRIRDPSQLRQFFIISGLEYM